MATRDSKEMGNTCLKSNNTKRYSYPHETHYYDHVRRRLGDHVFSNGDMKELGMALEESGAKMVLLSAFSVFEARILSDAAVMHMIINHPTFNATCAKQLLGAIWMYPRFVDEVTCDMFIKALRLLAVNAHAEEIGDVLKVLIQNRCTRSILERIDKLWCESCSDIGPETQLLTQLYTDICADESEESMNNSLFLVQKAIHVGIRRHIEVFIASLECDPSNILKENIYNRMKLFKLFSGFHSKVKLISTTFASLDETEVKELRDWYDYVSFHDSAVTNNFRQSGHVTEKVDDILRQIKLNIDKMPSMGESEDVRIAMKYMFRRLSEEIAKSSPSLAFTTKIVGSTAEGTRCIFPNEYDVFLKLANNHNEIIAKTESDLCEEIRSIMKKDDVILCNDQRLIFDNFVLTTTGNYPCLHVTWIGHSYKFMDISVDLVVVHPFKECVSMYLPKHNYAPSVICVTYTNVQSVSTRGTRETIGEKVPCYKIWNRNQYAASIIRESNNTMSSLLST